MVDAKNSFTKRSSLKCLFSKRADKLPQCDAKGFIFWKLKVLNWNVRTFKRWELIFSPFRYLFQSGSSGCYWHGSALKKLNSDFVVAENQVQRVNLNFPLTQTWLNAWIFGLTYLYFPFRFIWCFWNSVRRSFLARQFWGMQLVLESLNNSASHMGSVCMNVN